MTKKEILEMTGLSEQEFYQQYPTQESWTESYKKGGWIQKATASIKRRGTEGKCTPMSKPGCTGRALALAKTFHKMAAKRKKKEEGGYVDMYEEGGKIPDNVLRARLESHMSPGEAQDYIDSYAQGGVVDVYQLMGMPTPAMYGMGGTTNIGDLSHVISAKNFPNMGYAMGGQVNYPQGLRKNMGNMPIFAEGGMTGPLTEINVEKGELLTDKDGRIVTKYRGGGMVPHPEEGMDERGTVPAQEGMFVITKAQAKNYEKAMKGSDRLYADAIRNNISYDKTKKEAAEEQAAMTAMDKFVAKYGGAVRRMYAKGGMVPMYDLGGGTGGLNMNNPAFGSYNLPSSFSQDMTYSMFPSVPQSLNLDSTRPTMTTNTSIFGALGKGTYNWDNLPDSGVGYTGADTPSGDMSNFDKYASYAPYAMQGLPIAWNLAQSMKKPTKVPGTLGTMSTALEAPKMSGEAGRRALAREGAAARYAWRQAGAQAGPAALTALTNARMGRIADYEEGLRNAQGQMDYQAAAQRKAYEQFNAQQAMNRYMLQAQADAVPTQYASKGMEQLGQMGESMLNRQALKELYG